MAKRISRANARELKIIRSVLEKECRKKHGTILCEECLGKVCGCKDEKTSAGKLIIEHKDNDHLNWDPDNLQLASQSCNIKKNPPYRRDVDNVRDTRGVRDTVDEDIKPRSAEMLRNMKSEPTFQNWLKKEMNKKLRMELEDVINSGAHIAEVSIDTTRRYLKKLTSRLGPYYIELDSSGIKWLGWKAKFMPFKELIKKFQI